MRSEIPLRVLGALGPILSWVEGLPTQGLPRAWQPETSRARAAIDGRLGEIAASVQERDWLLAELPTYSLDTVGEVVAYGREEHPQVIGDRWRPEGHRLTPPPGYDLFSIFETLADRYLAWNGGKVVIRAGRMVEMHELGLRMPLGCIARHAHARAIVAGEQSWRDVERLPEAVSLLPSNAHGMRSVIRRGPRSSVCE